MSSDRPLFPVEPDDGQEQEREQWLAQYELVLTQNGGEHVDIRTTYGGDFLQATDLQPGAEHPMTITGCIYENVGQGNQAEEKLVLSFQGTSKRLSLNATNSKVLEALYGWETDAYTGKPITLYRVEGVNNPRTGVPGPGLRLKNPVQAPVASPAAAAAAAGIPPAMAVPGASPGVSQPPEPPPFDDDIPF